MNKQETDILTKCECFGRRTYSKMNSAVNAISTNRKGRAFLWGVTFCLFFAAILFLNIMTPLISDDFAYLYIYGENTQINSLSDIITSQVNHYHMWGGRSVVHFIAQVLLLLPFCIADLLNTLIYIGYAYLIYLHIKGRGQGSISLFILVNLAIWFFQPVIGDTILWLTGAANYLWGSFIILLFLLPFRMYEGKKKLRGIQIIFSAILFISGVLAGWTNENTAAAMILIVIFFILLYHYNKWDLPIWSYAGLVGSIVGFGFLILAPGNFERAGESSLTLFILAYRLFNSTLTYFYYCGPLILVCLLMVIVYRHLFVKEEIRDKNTGLLCSIYYIAGLAAVYGMLLSPTFPRRALFGVVTYMIVGCGILFYNLDAFNKLVRQLKYVIILVGLVSFGFTYYIAYKEIDTYRHIVEERENVISQAKKNGITSCEFESYSGGIYIHGEDPFSAELMSRYYGIDITFK